LSLFDAQSTPTFGVSAALHYTDLGVAAIFKDSIDLNAGEATTVKVKIQEVVLQLFKSYAKSISITGTFIC
jgi:hypothetical protein